MPSATTRAIGGVLVLSSVITAGLVVSPTATIEFVERLADDPMLFGLVVAGLYLVRPLFAWPTTPLAVVVGYGYGVTLGVPIALLGVSVTVIPVFVSVRWFAGSETAGSATAGAETAGESETVVRSDAGSEASADRSPATPGFGGHIGGLLARTENAVDRYYETAGPLRGVIASRLAPIPSDISTAAAAVGDVRLRQLLLGTVLGELPWTIAGVIIGASAATATTDGFGEVGLALTVACAIAAGLLLAGPTYRALRTRERSPDQP